MAIRYTDQFARETEAPKAFTPNFKVLDAALSSQQMQFDQFNDLSANLKINALTPDRQRANEIVSGFQNRADQVVDEYMKNGVLAGNRMLRNTTREIKKAFKPGGEAFQIENNFKAYQDYSKQIDKLFEKGDLQNANKVTWLKGNSLQKFSELGGTDFNQTTNDFNQFSGTQAAKDIDIAKLALERVKDWEASQVETGLYERVPGGYIKTGTNKFIAEEEVFHNVVSTLHMDPSVSAFIGQDADMRGLEGVDRQKHFSTTINKAAHLAAASKGFNQYNPKYLRDNLLLEDVKARNNEKIVRLKHSLKNDQAIVNGVLQVQQHAPIGGAGIEELSGHIDMHQKGMISAMKDLKDQMGDENYMNMLIDAGLPVDATSETIMKAMQDGFLDPSDPKYSRLSKGVTANVFNRLQSHYRQLDIGNRRMAKAHEEVKRRDPELYNRYYKEKPTSQISDLSGLLEQEFQGKSFNDELVAEAMTGSQDAVAKLFYGKPQSELNRGERLAFSNILQVFNETVDEIQETNPNIVEPVKVWAGSVREDKKQIDKLFNEQLNRKITHDGVTTTAFPVANPEDLSKIQKAVSDFVTDPARAREIIELSHLSPERKEELSELMEDGYKIDMTKNVEFVKNPIVTSNGPEFFMKVLATPTSEDGSESTEELLIPISKVNIPLMQQYTNSPEAQFLKEVAEYESSGLEELPLRNIPNVNLIRTGEGSNYATIRDNSGNVATFTRDEMFDFYSDALSSEQTRKDLGLTNEQYLKAVNIVNMMDSEGISMDPTDIVYQIEQALGVDQIKGSHIYRAISNRDLDGTSQGVDPQMFRR